MSHAPSRLAAVARRALASFLVLALASGCSSMKPLHGSFAKSLDDLPLEAPVRVVLKSGEQVDLTHVTVQGDSLRGTATIPKEERAPEDTKGTRPVAYAVADVQELQAVQPDGGKTVALVLAGLFIVVLVVAGLAGAATDYTF